MHQKQKKQKIYKTLLRRVVSIVFLLIPLFFLSSYSYSFARVKNYDPSLSDQFYKQSILTLPADVSNHLGEKTETNLNRPPFQTKDFKFGCSEELTYQKSSFAVLLYRKIAKCSYFPHIFDIISLRKLRI